MSELEFPRQKNKGRWSSAEYRGIIRKFKPTIMDYTEAPQEKSFCIIRHDVEFSLSRALELARLDNEEGIVSTFFIQIMNDSYNCLSLFSRNQIEQILGLGHHVGLHFYVSHIVENDKVTLHRELKEQTKVLELAIGQAVDRFSFHRPPRWVLELDGGLFSPLINAYDPAYFELTSGAAKPKEIKYIADSQHLWHYGHPFDAYDYQKFQILLHPDEWTPDGCGVLENFDELISRQEKEFVACIKGECRHFDRALQALDNV